MTAAEISDIADIDQPDTTVKTPTKGKGKAPAAAEKDDGRITVTIHPGAESEGTAPVKLGVNGHVYLIPRNTPVRLPPEAVQVLKDACITEYREVNGDIQPFDRQRFSFNIG